MNKWIVAPLASSPYEGETEEPLDTATVFERLRALNANTYFYHVAGLQDWDRLHREVAPAAQAAGIKVWVFLTGAGDCRDSSCDYAPFGHRYEEWGAAIARLSRVFPAVTAWSISDFASVDNLDYFTPSYVRTIRERFESIQPNLKFYPIVYFRHLDAWFLDRYASLLDAVIMPYAGALSNTQVYPDVEYVRLVTAIGMEYTASRAIAGVIQYSLPLVPGHEEKRDRNFSLGTGTGALVAALHEDEETSAGDWAGGRAVIRFDPGSTVCRLRFWHYDNRAAPTTTGRHLKQAWVNQQVVWEQDVATDDVDWFRTDSLNLTRHLEAAGGTATLILRLFEKRGGSGNRVLAVFDELSLAGCALFNQDPSFERAQSWVPARFGGPVVAGQHNYDPVYSTNVFNAVSQLYG